jgi:Lrp/AsnC family transcriptional regulator
MIEKLDKIDRAILNCLQNDASLAIDQLAEQVHLSRNACWRRVKLLEQAEVITKRVALVDPKKVGLGLSVMVLIRTSNHDPNWLKDFEKAVQDMSEIQAAHRMTGDLDYLLKVRVADVNAYDQFYQKLISKIDLTDVSASFVMQDLKDTTALKI